MMGASLTGLPGGPHTLKQETSYFEIVNINKKPKGWKNLNKKRETLTIYNFHKNFSF